MSAAAPPAATTASRSPADPRFDATLSEYPYPYPVEFFEVAAAGAKLRMAYLDEQAPRPNGKTVVLF